MIRLPSFKVKLYISFLEGKKNTILFGQNWDIPATMSRKKGTYLDIAQERDKKMTPFL